MKFQALFLGLLAVVSANPVAFEEDDVFDSLAERDAPDCTYSIKQPQPKGIYCNAVGNVRRPSSVGGALTPFANCRDSCLRQPFAACRSFSEGPKGFCTLYNNTIANMGFHPDPSGAKFFNRRCFKATCTCPEGQTNCSGDCVDLETDNAHCGTCTNSCGDGTTCVEGQCLLGIP